MHIHVTDQQGKRHSLDAVEGWRVMEIIREHGLDIKAECGGACACATCHVKTTVTKITPTIKFGYGAAIPGHGF